MRTRVARTSPRLARATVGAIALAASLSAQGEPSSEGFGGLSLAGARDLTGDPRIELELGAARDTLFAGERVDVRVRFALDRSFLEESLVQPFRRQIDVPVQLDLALESEAWSGAELLPPEPDALRREIVLGRELVPVTELRGRVSRSMASFELRVRLSPPGPGVLVLPAPRLRFAYATRFHSSFLDGGRTPLDRVDAFVIAERLELAVRALPEEGRPADFSGAVGRFVVRATAEPRDLLVGGTSVLSLSIEGAGALGGDVAPRLTHLDGMGGLDVVGLRAERLEGGLRMQYDLAVRRLDVRELPGIPFTYFDPDLGRYVTEVTDPISILVRPAPADGRAQGDPLQESEPASGGTRAQEAERPGSASGGEAAGEAPTARDSAGPDREDGGEVSGRGPGRWVASVATAIVALLLVVVVLRRRRGAVGDPAMAHEEVAHELRSALERSPGDPAPAMFAALAALLDCAPAAVEGGDLADRLEGRGLPEDLATAAYRAVARCSEARYGGDAAGDWEGARSEVFDWLERFEAHVRDGRVTFENR